MTSLMLMLMLLLIIVQRQNPVSSCPDSCMVCTDNTVICHRLAHIIDAPDTTKALLFTRGSITTVQSASLSVLSNITVIALSHNHISAMDELSFRNLPFLHTLLLDHNLLTSRALEDEALSNLTHLQVLALGHNLISLIQADWLKGTTELRTLNLEGNRIIRLGTGSLNNLRNLENLDLSDNFIKNLDPNSFHGLVRLRNLDVSRNRLSSVSSESFSYLNWLTNLNLDLNSWNCSCQLLDLATFLSAFLQQPDKTLYNGKKMVCVSADNPAVSTVLELTEANCVPSNQNITVQIEKKDSVTPQMYARDLAITAVLCFLGGIFLTLLIVLIYYRITYRKKVIQSQTQKEIEEGNGPEVNYLHNQSDVDEKQRKHFWNTHHLLDSKSIPPGRKTEHYERPFLLKDKEHDRYFICPDCKVEGPKLNQWDNGNNGVMLDGDRRRRRMLLTEEEEEKNQLEGHHDILGRGIPHNILSHGSSMSSSRKWKDTFTPKPDIPAAHHANKELGVRFDRQPGKLLCKSCHGAYGKSSNSMKESRIHSNMGDMSLSDDTVCNISNRWRSIESNQLNERKNMQTRNEIFSMERNHQGTRRRTYLSRKTGGETQRRHKGKLQSNSMLRSKPNLKAHGKTKIHPKMKTEQQRNDSRGKDRRQEEKQMEQMENKAENVKRSSKKGRTVPANEGVIGDEDNRDVRKYQRINAASKNVQISQDSNGYREETHQRDTVTVTPATSTKDTPRSTTAEGASIIGQGMTPPYNKAGIVLGKSQISSQQPFPSSAADKIHSTSPPIPGSAGSQLMDSNHSLQGRSLLLNTSIPAGDSVLPTDPTSSMFPNIVGNSSLSGNSHTQHCSESQFEFNIASPEQGNSDLSPDQDTGHKPSPLACESEPPSSFLPINTYPSIASSSEVNPQDPKAMNTVENLSKCYSQTENQTIQGGPVDSIFDGGKSCIEVQAVSEGDMLDPNVSPQGGSTRSTSTTGSGKATSPLLYQEYLSEEDGSTSRRKLRLVIPEKTSNREPTPLEKKIR